MKGRLPTPEERCQWRAATQHDQKWRESGEDESDEGEAEIATVNAAPLPNKSPSAARRPAHAAAPLIPNDLTALDGSRARRLKRGELPLDWVVDLHGMTREAAFHEVGEALREASARQMRCIAIITGKGRMGEGVLRRELPRWLNEGSLRALVVALAEAPAHLGGAGAYLVYLRKYERVAR
jgi:DNA-nicking Smr family endonuclease